MRADSPTRDRVGCRKVDRLVHYPSQRISHLLGKPPLGSPKVSLKAIATARGGPVGCRQQREELAGGGAESELADGTADP